MIETSETLNNNDHACMKNLQKIIEDKEKLIRKQFTEIEDLKNENKILRQERDALLCEVNKLQFEFEMTELKRLKDESTPQKPDRPPCGPGPPLKQLKSYSVDAGSPPTPPNQRTRQRSINGNVNSRKLQCRTNEEILKRSRIQTVYELSQDLLDKQVEMLERKYGGHIRASKAALTIQRAFRRYCMLKKFQYITSSAKSEKRLSRRFNTVDISNGDDNWTHHHVVSSLPNTSVKLGSAMAPSYADQVDPEAMIKSNFAALYKELSETLEGSANGQSFRPVRSLSLREKYLTPVYSSEHHTSDPHSNIYNVIETKDLNGNSSLPRSGSKIQNCSHASSRIRTNIIINHVDLCNSESDFSDKDVSMMEESTYYMPSSTMSPPVLVRNSGWQIHNGGKARSHSSMCMSNQLASPVDEHYLSGFHSSHDSVSDDSFIGSTPEDHHLQLSRDTVLRRTIASSPIEASFIKNRTHHRLLPNVCQKTLDPSLRRNSAPPIDLRRRVPPEVPKRTSSITTRTDSRGSSKVTEGGCKSDLVRSPDGGSLSSVQSSGSESSLTGSGSDRATPSGKSIDLNESHGVVKSNNMDVSPVWKRKSQVSEHTNVSLVVEDKRLSNISENSEDSLEGAGYSSSPPVSEVIYSSRSYQSPCLRVANESNLISSYKVSEVIRKRQYRVGLNLFNKKPEKGIKYLIQRSFLENSPQAVARFLISRKGLSKQMIGEYLGNLQCPFNMEVLDCFAGEMDLAGMQVDVALRKFQTYFRMPGEAQKIERLMEIFGQHYYECNRDVVSKLHSPDTIFILAFAIIMLNTDLHTPNLKPERRMKLEDFIKNLRGIDDGHDLDRDMLIGTYERIKANEFRPGSDHVTQVMKVQQTIVGKKPNLALPHRRLVCYCRLYEVNDIHKKERQGLHQREVFLFNDVLVVTKIFSKKKNSVTYTFRQSFPLVGMQVQLFEVPYYPHGIHLVQKVDNKLMITFNARNEHDRCKFVEDLRESIYEMDEMENIRIETELEKQKLARSRTSENRDSGVADMELPNGRDSRVNADCGLKRSALSNSLLDIHEQSSDKPQRRGSAGSLDSGMSISFQSSAASTVSRDSSPQQTAAKVQGKSSTHQSFLGGLFGKRGKNTPKSNAKAASDSTDA